EVGEAHLIRRRDDLGARYMVGDVDENHSVGVEWAAVAVAGPGDVLNGAGKEIGMLELPTPALIHRPYEAASPTAEHVALDGIGGIARSYCRLDGVVDICDRSLFKIDEDPGMGLLEIAHRGNERRGDPVVGHQHPQNGWLAARRALRTATGDQDAYQQRRRE